MTCPSFKTVVPTDVSHVNIYHDEEMYAAHPNRGGIWNFGNGEIAVAHLLKPVDYNKGKGVNHWYAEGTGSGVMLNRSYDGGQTWPKEEKEWIWNNNRPVKEIYRWLYERPAKSKNIDMAHSDSIMHFGLTHNLRKGTESSPSPIWDNFTFCLRSNDRGHTWESKPSIVPVPAYADGLIVANLGAVNFSNGVIGIVASYGGGKGVWARNGGVCYLVSYDQGLSWDIVSRVAHDSTGQYQYTYAGLHQLPDGRLLCSMHRLVKPLGDYPCVATSDDGGMTWSEPRYIVRPDRVPPQALPQPGSFELPMENRRWFSKDGKPISDWLSSYRSPTALVTRDGRIIIVFARRRPPYGIGGVVSEDLGETWSQEFVLRNDGTAGDCGYPVITELKDGRIFTAYYIATFDRHGRIPSIQQDSESAEDNPGAWKAMDDIVEFYPFSPIRHVVGTSFRL